MAKSSRYPYIVRKAQIEQAEATFSHPWNPASLITGTRIGRLGGLSRTGISLACIAPGKESFAYHLHHSEEEWIYILAGKAIAHIDGQDYDLEPGDFVAFPTPSVAHNLANHSDEELVYLMGGENHANEIADFPSLDRRLVRIDGEVTIYRLSEGKGFDES